MRSIGAVTSQPWPSAPPPRTTKVDRDGDHDNNAPDHDAAQAQGASGGPRAGTRRPDQPPVGAIASANAAAAWQGSITGTPASRSTMAR
jgi:hypothetical protein